MSEQNNELSTSGSKKHKPTQVDNIIIENKSGFDVDWDSIESNVKSSEKRKQHRHHKTEHGRHSSGEKAASSSEEKDNTYGTHLKHTVTITEKHEKKKKHTFLKIMIGILIFILFLMICLLIAFFILRYQGKQALLDNGELNIQTIDEADSKNNGQTIIYNGKTYLYNPYVTSILFMGVDKENLELEDDIVGTGGQADALYLLSYDISDGDVKIISFSRDTLVDVNIFSANGNYIGIENTQLCLAYAYGDGKELSAENVVTSLQRIIYNIPINSYFVMDLSAIQVLNDDIGGVTLTPLFTFGDFVEGEKITLNGEQAETYVRIRDVSLLDSNVGRMERQQQYITSFANQIVPAVQNDISIPLNLYNDVKDYIVTNLTPSKITYLASSIATSYNGLEIINVPGSIIASEEDGKAQFIPDETKLYEILLDTFYTVED